MREGSAVDGEAPDTPETGPAYPADCLTKCMSFPGLCDTLDYCENNCSIAEIQIGNCRALALELAKEAQESATP
eukprot:CAMPEP_0204517340 /NCGR_PEP_ID=MMETSP0661-20131031/3619_1 /ASSEMBLY_ACC=CAM_ASM_000606 /TAXON_ID=109239 /ORGANISM="Alexandrium margalefi, Strain AMGDE01CS-322" /LENGTH=73 /DNA_ID=CAMNT_0051522735 /DNA_START=62 /DNA_END=283 /DNA_ORIENTATION=-